MRVCTIGNLQTHELNIEAINWSLIPFICSFRRASFAASRCLFLLFSTFWLMYETNRTGEELWRTGSPTPMFNRAVSDSVDKIDLDVEFRFEHDE